MADHDLFFSRTGMDRGRVQQTVDAALKGSDDGELYLEYSQSESFSFDDGRLKAATPGVLDRPGHRRRTRGRGSGRCRALGLSIRRLNDGSVAFRFLLPRRIHDCRIALGFFLGWWIDRSGFLLTSSQNGGASQNAD